MSEWRECKLGDVVTLKRGFDLPTQNRVNGVYPVYSSSGLTGYHSSYMVEGEGVITGRYGTIGEVFFAKDSHWPLNTTLFVDDFHGNDKKFVYWFLQTINWEGLLTASAVPGINRNHAHMLSVTVPPLPTQRAIAEVLSSIDEKIGLLTRQNATLEALAQAYFRQWFVEGASDFVKLGDYITLFDSKRIPLSAMERVKKKSGTLYPYYGAASIMDYINDYIFDGEYILLGEDGTVETTEGYPALQYATGKFWCNNHAHVIQAKAPFTNYTLWCFLKQCSISHIITGAVQPKINQENLRSIELPFASPDIFDKTNEMTGTIYRKVLSNNAQIQTLQKLRDMLMPKLISGEIQVKDVSQ